MYNKTYWGYNNAGKFHFFAIDWYCKRILGEPIPDDLIEEEEIESDSEYEGNGWDD